MLALIALYVMRPPFMATIEDDPTDTASEALRLELERRHGHEADTVGMGRSSDPPEADLGRPARAGRAGLLSRHRAD